MSPEELASHGVAVVVPAYNEARLIGRTIASVPHYVSRVVVVDDGSSDDTAEAVRALGDPRVQLVRHPENRGVGAAIVSGYREAFAAGVSACAVMAGDGQMHPGDLPALLAPALRGHADYVKGNRLAYPAARSLMPWTRWLGNVVLAALTGLATGRRVCDSQCGYTVLTRRAADQLPLERLWPRYGYPNDLIGMVAEQGLSLEEVTVRPVYADEDSGLRLRHALVVVPFVLLRVLLRRLARPLFAAVADDQPTV
jgi:glycosyltransferase involved in cell wall biosynthesis